MLQNEIKTICNGIIFHTKCVSHILISMVQTCLDYVNPIITKFENMLLYLCHYPKREQFIKFLQEKGIRFSEPRLPLPNKWNTTYKMLGRILDQKSLFVEFYTKCGVNDIDDNDWEIVESLLGILKVFQTSTVSLSNAYYPTTPLVLGETLLISNMFKEYKQNLFWQPLVIKMETDFLKYCETIPSIFSCAACLNPNVGFEGVAKILKDIELNLGLENDFAKNSVTKFGTTFEQLFNYYDIMHSNKKDGLFRTK